MRKKNFPTYEEMTKEQKQDYYFNVVLDILIWPMLFVIFYFFFLGSPEWSWIPENLSSWNGIIDFLSKFEVKF